MNQRELELLHRAEAAERAVIEAVRQRDILLAACQDTLTRLEWWASGQPAGVCYSSEPADRSLAAGFATLRLALEKVSQ